MWLTFRDVSFGPDSIPGQTLDRIVLFMYHADGPLAMDGDGGRACTAPSVRGDQWKGTPFNKLFSRQRARLTVRKTGMTA